MKVRAIQLTPLFVFVGCLFLVGLLEVLTQWVPGFEFFQRLEWITYDWRLRVAHKMNPPVSDKLGFVYIGDDPVAIFSEGRLGTNFQFGLYWPRHVYGRLVRELHAQGARAIGLDVMFGEGRPDHPPVYTTNGPVASDRFFEEQLQRAGNVVLAADKGVVPYPPFRRSARAIGDISIVRDSDGVLRRVRAFNDYRIWHPAIKREARFNNWDLASALVRTNEIVFIPSSGKKFALALTEDGLFDPTQLNPGKPRQGFVRLQPPFEDTRVWHMGIVLAAQDLGLDLASAIVELKENQIVLAGTNGVVRAIPVDADGYLLVDWTMTHKDDRLTKDAFETLVANDDRRERGEHPPDRFRDKLVVVGSTATGNELTDRGATPLENDTFLTSSHWNVMNAMLTDRFIRFTGAGTGMLLICLLGAVGAFLTLYLRPGRASASVLLLAVAYMLLTVLLFNAHRLWLPLVMPLAGLFLTNLALVTYRVGFEQKERRHIKSVFDKIVSPNIVEELLDAGDLALGGARRKITVCFADVRGFTEMTDQHHAKAEDFARLQNLTGAAADNYFDEQAAEVLRTVNLYLGRIADMVKQHAGTLDKYIGDCVMAFWGAPTPNEQHACAAVRAAIDAQRAVYALNQERFQENKRREQENIARLARGELPLAMLHLLSIGTGINTGMMTVGLMGSDKHIVNYTVFGREVNLAQRLESYSGRSRIIIGEATYLDLKRDNPALAAACVELAPEIFRGFRAAVKIYEVPWKQDKPEPAVVKDAPAAAGR